jgi:phosphoglycerate kinase
MRNVRDIKDLSGKKVFLRADFNVPVSGGKVADDFRIKKSFDTINFLRDAGAKIIIGSHFEGEGGSLRAVFEYLKVHYPISFIEEYYPDKPNFNEIFTHGEIVLLENLRKYPEEKANDEAFAKQLASFADVYVNEAFSSSHRVHASIVGIPKNIPSYVGLSFSEEVRELSKAFEPEHPFVFILGGAKFETKMPLIRKFFSLADKVFIGGALANDFFRSKGISIGHSTVSMEVFDVSTFLNDKLILPHDVCVESNGECLTKAVGEINPHEYIVDVGPESIEDLKKFIKEAKFVLWNGPLGNYEAGHKEGTLSLAKAIAESGAISIVGGGDTIASIAELGLNDKFTFISTAGGAMLDYLANESLPGIEALK